MYDDDPLTNLIHGLCTLGGIALASLFIFKSCSPAFDSVFDNASMIKNYVESEEFQQEIQQEFEEEDF